MNRTIRVATSVYPPFIDECVFGNLTDCGSGGSWTILEIQTLGQSYGNSVDFYSSCTPRRGLYYRITDTGNISYTLSHRDCGQFRPCLHENFEKIQNNFDPDGQLDSIAPEAPSTARRGRNHLEFFKIFMQTGAELSTLSMGQSIH